MGHTGRMNAPTAAESACLVLLERARAPGGLLLCIRRCADLVGLSEEQLREMLPRQHPGDAQTQRSLRALLRLHAAVRCTAVSAEEANRWLWCSRVPGTAWSPGHLALMGQAAQAETMLNLKGPGGMWPEPHQDFPQEAQNQPIQDPPKS